jgi:hypothetical protein
LSESKAQQATARGSTRIILYDALLKPDSEPNLATYHFSKTFQNLCDQQNLSVGQPTALFQAR